MRRGKEHRLAYCYSSSLGGPLTEFFNLRKALEPLGWKLLFVSVGPCSVKADVKSLLKQDYTHIGEGTAENIRIEVAEFVNFMKENNIDIVVTYGDNISIQSLPYLPISVKVISIFATPTKDAMIRATMNIERINRIVAISDGIQRRMLKKLRIPPYIIEVITPQVDLSIYPPIESIRAKPVTRPTRICFLGRIRDLDKGVDLLPEIAARLKKNKVEFTLTIIGEGPQKAWLENELRKLKCDSHVGFLGGRPPNEIPKLLFDHDILVMPSRFEGFGRVLLEAMAAGVVPVASSLRGATDMIVDHDINGILCPVGKPKAFADAIYSLCRNPDRLKTMAIAGRKSVEEGFSLSQIAKAYHRLFTEVTNESAAYLSELPISQFKPDERLYKLNESWRSKIPGPIKKVLLTVRARVKW